MTTAALTVTIDAPGLIDDAPKFAAHDLIAAAPAVTVAPDTLTAAAYTLTATADTMTDAAFSLELQQKLYLSVLKCRFMLLQTILKVLDFIFFNNLMQNILNNY